MVQIRRSGKTDINCRLLASIAFTISVVCFISNPGHFSTPCLFSKNKFREQRGDSSPREMFVASSSVTKESLLIDREFGPRPTDFAEKKTSSDADSCRGVKKHKNFANSCEYVKANKQQCSSDGFIEYIRFFYCASQDWPVLRIAVLVLWLLALIYMLGNTAAEYFCPSLNSMAELLRLPPTVAGVTLLAFGNGAPDFFSSIASFIGASTGQLGLNSVLGGGIFVATVVVGSISLIVSGSGVAINRTCFVRDVGFYLFSLLCLGVILIVGKINLLGAIAFLSIYVLYAIAVAGKEIFSKYNDTNHQNCLDHSLLDSEKGAPEEANSSLIQWKWDFSYTEEDTEEGLTKKPICRSLVEVLVLPLVIPRKLTIPNVDESQWSKAYAVSSVVLAPFLLSFIYDSQDLSLLGIGKSIYIVALILGVIMGTLVFVTTSSESPPKTCAFPLAAGGFLMSMVWFYLLANEFVSLLVALGTIFSLSPSLIGLTVMAWGNSIGDLIANITLALNGDSGVQIALSGCYAGPMFNTVVALGTSLLIETCIEHPVYQIPGDDSIFYMLGFLVAALLWSLVTLPNSDMRPSKLHGISLIALYFAFLSLRLIRYYVHTVGNGNL